MGNITDLSLYPRAKRDTRFSIHFSAESSAPAGPPGSWRMWLERAYNMGCGYPILLTDRDAASLVDKQDPGRPSPLDLCFEMGQVPVVRIYTKASNALGWLWDDTVKEATDRLVAKGVRYVKTWNEPNLEAEWDGGRPADWAERSI